MSQGQTELNEGLAAHCWKPGTPGNPDGKQGSPELRMTNRKIAEALREKGDEPCEVEGFEGMTWFEAVISTLFRQAVAGVPWAVKELHNRAFGRVPFDVKVDERRLDVLQLVLPDNGRPAQDVIDVIAERRDVLRLIPKDGASAVGNQPSDEETSGNQGSR